MLALDRRKFAQGKLFRFVTGYELDVDRAILENDPDVVTALGDTIRDVLDDAFDISRSLRNVGRIFAALKEVEA